MSREDVTAVAAVVANVFDAKELQVLFTSLNTVKMITLSKKEEYTAVGMDPANLEYDLGVLEEAISSIWEAYEIQRRRSV
jgi:hypothetical protein